MTPFELVMGGLAMLALVYLMCGRRWPREDAANGPAQQMGAQHNNGFAMQPVRYSVTLAPRFELTRPSRGTAKVRVDRAFPVHPLGPAAKAWLVAERGIGNLHLEEFADEQVCRARARDQTFSLGVFDVRPCYLVFAVRGNTIVEVEAGGTNTFARATCAYHGTRWLRTHYGA